MNLFEKKVEIRWSDIDALFHVRHSVYFDYAAYCRISFLNENGVTPDLMMQHNIGPVIFREECVFKREIKFGDDIVVNLTLEKSTADMSKWTMINELWKNGDVLAAIVTVDGAWLDTKLRKLTPALEIIQTAFGQMPRANTFQVFDRK